MIGEMHCHTCLSRPYWLHRNLPDPFALVDYLIKIGLNFAAITDHDTQAAFAKVNDYALERGLVLIPAVEISTKMSKLPHKRPHILAYGVIEKVPSRKSIGKTIDAIHAQGGLAVAAHPYGIKYNKATYMGDMIRDFDFDGVEVYNSDEDLKANAQALWIAQELNLLPFAGSDAHALANVGNSRIELLIPKTSDWKEIISAIQQKQYTIVATNSNHSSDSSDRMRSSSISLLYRSLRGKAS